MIAETVASLERSRRRNASCQSPAVFAGCESVPTGRPTAGAVPMTDGSATTPSPSYPRVEQRIDQIDDEVHDRDDEPKQQNGADDDRVVTSGDTLHEVAADTWHLVDRLDEKRSGRDVRENHPGNRDDREQCITHPVTHQDRPLRETLRSRRTHVVRAEHLQQT